MAAYGTEGKRPSATAQKMEQAGYVNIQKAMGNTVRGTKKPK